MKKQKIKRICQEKDCKNFKIEEWNGEYLGKWFCRKHAYKYLEGEQ